jgi:hypothetical protein
VDATRNSVQQKYPGGLVYADLPNDVPGRFTVTGGGIRHRGGQSTGDGYPDVVWKQGSRIKIWEVKWDSPSGALVGARQVRRYVDAAERNMDLTAEAGGWLKPGGPLPIAGN